MTSQLMCNGTICKGQETCFAITLLVLCQALFEPALGNTHKLGTDSCHSRQIHTVDVRRGKTVTTE